MKPKTKLSKIRLGLSKVVKNFSIYNNHGWFTDRELKIIKNETEVLGIRIKHLKEATQENKKGESR